jgi:sterol desaturase/sphingolipid hydroxylase (fatty acid hydroxylase superfamily)
VLFQAFTNLWLLGLLAALATAELGAPRRSTIAGRGLRWPTNLTLGGLNAVLVTLSLAPVGLAAAAADVRWGVFNRVSVPPAIGIAVAVVALDALVYLQHRVLHANAALWRVHRVHHADVDLDATTGLRFHPIEALLTQVTLGAGIVILGLPAVGVAAYLVVSAAMTILTHANVRLPSTIERAALWVFVTPALHAIHHSARPGDLNRNFATVFSLWDRLGSTFRSGARGRDEDFRAGLAEFREPRYLTLPWTLVLPFCAPPRLRASAGHGLSRSPKSKP